MSSIVEIVSVYYSNRSGRGKADYVVPYTVAKELVEDRMAIWEPKKARYIILRKTPAGLHRPAKSLTMGSRVTEMAAAGKPYFLALVEAYRPADRAA